MNKRFYLDTSIWLDFFIERDEPHFPKSTMAKQLVRKILKQNGQIVLSDLVAKEMHKVGFHIEQFSRLLGPLQPIILYVVTSKKQAGKAKDLGYKRNVPKKDALHALIARDVRAQLITHDPHFKRLRDISKSYSVQSFL